VCAPTRAHSTVFPGRHHDRVQLTNGILRSRVWGGKIRFFRSGSCETSLDIFFRSQEYLSKMNSPSVKAMTSVPTGIMSPWALMIATCLLLATSGGVRFWREGQFATIARENERCPFALSEFPKQLGTWQADEGTAAQLDPQIARIAGANSHLLQNYVDQKSGMGALVLILYGKAASVFGHNPEICYPANGYKLVNPPGVAEHQFSDSISRLPVRFRSAFFSKHVGATNRYEEVYYTFWHNGQWVPEVTNQWKLFRYHPGMFKVLLTKPATDFSTQNSPIESLLKEIVREIDVRIAQNKPLTASAMTPSKAAVR
jgi:Protein of unknown function (DUF3485)